MVTIIDTLHSDMIHDAQFDFPGRRVATCSSDRTVRIYQVESSAPHSLPGGGGAGMSANTSGTALASDLKQQQQQHRLIAILDGHDGPVWQICWAYPKFGSLLASCSYDRKVILWKETPVTSNWSANAIASNSATNSTWSKFHEYQQHTSSVNSIIFAPHELGLVLAACSSDGSASIIDYTNCTAATSGGVSGYDTVQPEVKRIQNCHQGGCNAISWGPAVPPSSLLPSDSSLEVYQKTFVTGGCDNLVKIWRFAEEEGCGEGGWVLEETLHGHKDWVRDVAWAPSVGLPLSTIASCSQDGIVKIWRKDAFGGGGVTGVHYQCNELGQFPDVVWHVSWSFTGNILAVSGGDNEVTLWKEKDNNEWNKISEVNKAEK